MQYFNFFKLCLTLLAQKILSVITYSREELLDIRATFTYQHYDQEYNFPIVGPLSTPLRAFELIPEADRKPRPGEEGDGAVFCSDFRGLHTTHRFRVYYSRISSP